MVLEHQIKDFCNFSYGVYWCFCNEIRLPDLTFNTDNGFSFDIEPKDYLFPVKIFIFKLIILNFIIYDFYFLLKIII